jgi:hypothetical protein
MFKYIIILITFCIPGFSCFSQSDTTGKYFTVVYKTGPAWESNKSPEEQKFFREHSQFLSGLRKQGIIKAGARYDDIGLLIVKLKNLEDAEMLIKSDVSLKNGLFVVSVFDANFFYKGCID